MKTNQKIETIWKQDIPEENYLNALLEYSQSVCLLNTEELNAIQLQVVELLSDQIRLYTGGESSSVQAQTAHELLNSALYCVGIYLKSICRPENEIAAIKENQLSGCFQKGLQTVRNRVNSTKSLFFAVRKTQIKTRNLAYIETLTVGIPIFFKIYHPDFLAHEIPSAIDYPLCRTPILSTGIEYISQYLKSILLENQFCQRFEPSVICNVLCQCHEQDPELFINLFENLLRGSLCGILSGKTSFCPEAVSLVHIPRYLSELKDTALFSRATQNLFTEQKISSPALQEYAIAAAKRILQKHI